ncbi:hypothetical protein [Lentzea nigeriaca]|uniref:hypothetical protein n=1 Tax=Lentzea nigeriaca TaxID=1128665 RepID=UPI00195ADEBC|nr:hypothetical protein [Lentzea nigeriaca]MBM7864917.1 hypothetical protein [Lentzea nigeriaca]
MTAPARRTADGVCKYHQLNINKHFSTANSSSRVVPLRTDDRKSVRRTSNWLGAVGGGPIKSWWYLQAPPAVPAGARAEIVRVGWKNEIKGSPSRGDAGVSVKSGGTR